LVRKYPNGYTVEAWLEQDPDEGIVVKAQWRHQNKPCAQPFYVRLEAAKEVFDLLAAFSAELRSQYRADDIEPLSEAAG
jgi:hypothetical protein